MKYIKTLLIDDEPDSIAVLDILLKQACPQIKIVGRASSANQAIEQVQLYKPDLLFLDIEMPGKDGFDVLKTFENPKFKVIIITGNEQYALKAIKASAIDYLLKPVALEELKIAITKVIQTLSVDDNRIEHFNSIVKNKENTIDKIIIPTLKGFRAIKCDNIVSIEAQAGNYCLFKLSNQKLDLVTKPMNYFEELLPKEMFFRVHRSHMVNLSKVREYQSKDGLVIMENGVTLEVAVRRKAEFRKEIKKLPILSNR